MNGFRVAALIAAVLTTGLMAGVYASYANAVMPGLAKTDDNTLRVILDTVAFALLAWSLYLTGKSAA
jgi:uncharacterized membrane protein